MKRKFFWFLLLSLVFAACKDNSEIGMAVLPAEDALAIVTDSFHIKTATVEVGDVYSETTKPVLGTYHDELFGDFSVDFMSEFRYVRGQTFPEGSASDSLYLVMYYNSFIGDSSAVHEATAYRIDLQALDFNRNFTVNTDVSEFCSMNEVLGKTTYVAYDRTISDSIRNISGYYDKVMIPLPLDLASQIISTPSLMESQSNFVDFFKGVYVRNTYGSQTVLEIDSVNLEMFYHYPPDLTKPDSLLYRTVVFPANLESTTFTHIEERTNPLLQSLPDSLVAISSPGGTMLQMSMPWERIYDRVCSGGAATGINVNNASVILKAMDLGYEGELEPPAFVIMINEKDVEAFFTQSLYPMTGVDTYLGMYMTADSTYLFANMASMVQKILDAGPDGFEEKRNMLIMPVDGTTDIDGTNASIYNKVIPSGGVFGSGSNVSAPLRLVVTYTDL